MIGNFDSAIARATDSILKHHKSSIEPPPLAKIIRSKSEILLALFMAFVMSLSAFLPWT